MANGALRHYLPSEADYPCDFGEDEGRCREYYFVFPADALTGGASGFADFGIHNGRAVANSPELVTFLFLINALNMTCTGSKMDVTTWEPHHYRALQQGLYHLRMVRAPADVEARPAAPEIADNAAVENPAPAPAAGEDDEGPPAEAEAGGADERPAKRRALERSVRLSTYYYLPDPVGRDPVPKLRLFVEPLLHDLGERKKRRLVDLFSMTNLAGVLFTVRVYDPEMQLPDMFAMQASFNENPERFATGGFGPWPKPVPDVAHITTRSRYRQLMFSAYLSRYMAVPDALGNLAYNRTRDLPEWFVDHFASRPILDKILERLDVDPAQRRERLADRSRVFPVPGLVWRVDNGLMPTETLLAYEFPWVTERGMYASPTDPPRGFDSLGTIHDNPDLLLKASNVETGPRTVTDAAIPAARAQQLYLESDTFRPVLEAARAKRHRADRAFRAARAAEQAARTEDEKKRAADARARAAEERARAADLYDTAHDNGLTAYYSLTTATRGISDSGRALVNYIHQTTRRGSGTLCLMDYRRTPDLSVFGNMQMSVTMAIGAGPVSNSQIPIALLWEIAMSVYIPLKFRPAFGLIGRADTSKSYTLQIVSHMCVRGTVTQSGSESAKAQLYADPVACDEEIRALDELPRQVTVPRDRLPPDSDKFTTELTARADGIYTYSVVLKRPDGTLDTVRLERVVQRQDLFCTNVRIADEAMASRMETLPVHSMLCQNQRNKASLPFEPDKDPVNDPIIQERFHRMQALVFLAGRAIWLGLLPLPDVSLIGAIDPIAVELLNSLNIESARSTRRIVITMSRYMILVLLYAVHVVFFSELSPHHVWSEGRLTFAPFRREQILDILPYLGPNEEIALYVIAAMIDIYVDRNHIDVFRSAARRYGRFGVEPVRAWVRWVDEMRVARHACGELYDQRECWTSARWAYYCGADHVERPEGYYYAVQLTRPQLIQRTEGEVKVLENALRTAHDADGKALDGERVQQLKARLEERHAALRTLRAAAGDPAGDERTIEIKTVRDEEGTDHFVENLRDPARLPRRPDDAGFPLRALSGRVRAEELRNDRLPRFHRYTRTQGEGEVTYVDLNYVETGLTLAELAARLPAELKLEGSADMTGDMVAEVLNYHLRHPVTVPFIPHMPEHQAPRSMAEVGRLFHPDSHWDVGSDVTPIRLVGDPQKKDTRRVIVSTFYCFFDIDAIRRKAINSVTHRHTRRRRIVMGTVDYRHPCVYETFLLQPRDVVFRYINAGYVSQAIREVQTSTMAVGDENQRMQYDERAAQDEVIFVNEDLEHHFYRRFNERHLLYDEAGELRTDNYPENVDAVIRAKYAPGGSLAWLAPKSADVRYPDSFITFSGSAKVQKASLREMFS